VADELIQVIASCGIHDDAPPNALAAFEPAIQADFGLREDGLARRDG
jgi:hypothetical protein